VSLAQDESPVQTLPWSSLSAAGSRAARPPWTSSNSDRKTASSYRLPLLPPFPIAARSPRLPPGSLFSFDRRWSIFLRPLSCFCFATRTPISGGQNLSTLGSSRRRAAPKVLVHGLLQKRAREVVPILVLDEEAFPD
jgi:hypothetical protein